MSLRVLYKCHIHFFYFALYTNGFKDIFKLKIPENLKYNNDTLNIMNTLLCEAIKNRTFCIVTSTSNTVSCNAVTCNTLLGVPCRTYRINLTHQ